MRVSLTTPKIPWAIRVAILFGARLSVSVMDDQEGVDVTLSVRPVRSDIPFPLAPSWWFVWTTRAKEASEGFFDRNGLRAMLFSEKKGRVL